MKLIEILIVDQEARIVIWVIPDDKVMSSGIWVIPDDKVMFLDIILSWSHKKMSFTHTMTV